MSKQDKTGGAPARAPQNKGGGKSAARAPQPARRDETDTFIEEVTEELQRDRLYAQFRKYGPYAIAAIVALVGGAAINEYLGGAKDEAARRAGDALTVASEAADPAAAFLDLAQNEPDGVAMVARFRAADARLGSGDAAGAAALLDEIAADNGIDPLYRDLATLKAAMSRLSHGEARAAADALLPLTTPQNPFRALALELRASALLELGETDAARGALIDAIAEETAPQNVRTRAQLLLDAIGGPVEAPTDEADEAAETGASAEGGGEEADGAADAEAGSGDESAQ